MHVQLEDEAERTQVPSTKRPLASLKKVQRCNMSISQITNTQMVACTQLEEEARRAQVPSKEERLRAAAAEAVRSRAALARMEASDEAKRMNQMVLYSKCVAIRCARTCQPCITCRRHLPRALAEGTACTCGNEALLYQALYVESDAVIVS